MKKAAPLLGGTLAAVAAARTHHLLSGRPLDGASAPSLALCAEVLITPALPFSSYPRSSRSWACPLRLGRPAAPLMSRLFGVSGPGCASLVLGLMARIPARRSLGRGSGAAQRAPGPRASGSSASATTRPGLHALEPRARVCSAHARAGGYCCTVCHILAALLSGLLYPSDTAAVSSSPARASPHL